MYNEGTRIDSVIGTLYQCTIKYRIAGYFRRVFNFGSFEWRSTCENINFKNLKSAHTGNNHMYILVQDLVGRK